MGTFHHGKGELHGITVAVDTRGARVWVGRCDTIDEQGVHLLDADLHEASAGQATKADWLAQAARFGVWPRHPSVLVPTGEVVSVTRLGDLRPA